MPLPGRFKCICGEEHRIIFRTYIDTGETRVPVGLGCKKYRKVIENAERGFYKKGKLECFLYYHE
ncbi:MAG: hypothetical protein QXN71_01005 [Candidatus Aenigmatarchaeota archaeon]